MDGFKVEIIDGYFIVKGYEISFDDRVFADLGDARVFISGLLGEMENDNEPSDDKSEIPE